MGKRKKNKPLKLKQSNNNNNQLRSKIISWFEDVITLIKEHKNLMMIIVIFVAFVIAAIVVSTSVAKRKSEAQAQAEAEAQAEAQQYVVTDEPLEIDAYPEINALMRQYYDVAAAGDVDTLMSIKSSVDEKEKIVLVKKAELIDNFPVVTVYTKKGPEEDTFIVFAYYEVKLKDFEENVPGLNAWYVSKREDGSYYINDDEQSEELENYCKLISVQDDVVDLHNTVNVKFNEIVVQDEELAAFLDSITDVLVAAVGEELVKEDAAANEPEASQEPAEETTDNTNTVLKAKATDVVNIRTSDSENADRIGKAQKGDVFTVLEQKANGWSKIEYDGSEAYIKSEYLEVISESSTQTESTDTPSADNNADDTTNPEAAANSPSSGTATATSTINVRKSPSTEADKLAVCYQGEQLTVVQKQADGWTKVKYNGKTGYVKSEYLE